MIPTIKTIDFISDAWDSVTERTILPVENENDEESKKIIFIYLNIKIL